MERLTLRKLDNGIIAGIHWPVSDPEAIICIIHGIGEYGERYGRVAGRLNEAGFSVFSMDLRGHGRSLGKRGDCAPRDEVLEDVSALISHASRAYPGRKLMIYGHSLGGNITLDYRDRGAFRDLPSAYLLSAPWIRLVRSIPPIAYGAAKAMSHIAPGFTIGSRVSEDKLGNPENILPYHSDPMIHNRISIRCAVEGFETGRRLGSVPYDRPSHVPTLIMHGGNDGICDIEGSRDFCRIRKRAGENVEFKELPGILHEIHNGGPESNGDEVLEMMVDFFRRF